MFWHLEDITAAGLSTRHRLLAIEWQASSVHHAADQLVADWNFDALACSLDLHALLDTTAGVDVQTHGDTTGLHAVD